MGTNSLTVCHLSFLPWVVLATSVIGVSRGDHSPSATSASSLRSAHPERFPDQLPVGPVYFDHPNSSSLLSPPTQSFKVFSFFSYLLFNTIILRFLVPFAHTTLGAVFRGVASAPTFPALKTCFFFYASEVADVCISYRISEFVGSFVILHISPLSHLKM
jgi:hypothetical protein